MKVSLQAEVAAVPATPGGVSAGGEWLREFHAARRLAWFHGSEGASMSDPIGDGRCHAASGSPAPVVPGAQTRAPGASFVAGATTAQAATVAAAWPRLPALPAGFGSGAPPVSAPSPLQGGSVGVASPAVGASQPAGGQGVASFGGPAPLRLAAASAPRTAAAGPPERVEQPSMPRAPMRVHVEESSQGLVLWVGIDARAGAPAVRPATLAAELRRVLASSGQRLDSVVCNGTAVPSDPHFHKEP